MMEHGHLDFQPQALKLVMWKPDDPATPVKGVIAALHGFGVHAELGFHYLGPFMANRGWITVAIDLPGLGHWQPAEKRALKAHWKLLPKAVSCLVKKCQELAHGEPVFLLGSSLGGLACVDYVLHHRDTADGHVSAVVGLVPAIGTVSLPWYLWLGAGLLLAFCPVARIPIARYAGMGSHDPKSIILQPDPIALDKVSIGYLGEIFKSINKAGIKGKGQARWDSDIPLYLLSAGLDNFVKESDVKVFYNGLPERTFKVLRHRANDYHGVLYEADRDEVFADIDSFLNTVLEKKKSMKNGS
nr:alpha/beta hydrolase [Candidatus Sigynarchaeota archaeon]